MSRNERNIADCKQFGALVEGADLNDLDDETFSQIRKAVYENGLVLIKNQQALTPQNHFNFVHRFDPTAEALHGHGSMKTVQQEHKGSRSLLAKGSTYSIPEAPGVRLVAAGYQGEDHYGLKDVYFEPGTIRQTQVNPPAKEEMDAGIVRFGRW
jgi:xanthine dioxygenase